MVAVMVAVMVAATDTCMVVEVVGDAGCTHLLSNPDRKSTRNPRMAVHSPVGFTAKVMAVCADVATVTVAHTPVAGSVLATRLLAILASVVVGAVAAPARTPACCPRPSDVHLRPVAAAVAVSLA